MIKRLFDIIIASLVLIIALPLICVIAILSFLLLGRPIFFRQQRPGIYGEAFLMVKLRTMRDDKDASGNLLPDEQRLTRYGRFLRSSSLDELPELWNVLKGDMSLVGPRPLLMHYLPLYDDEQMRRHNVRPGVTGWAQVKGRNALSWEEKFKLDIWYVEHQSFWLDIKILFMTLWTIMNRKGISAEGSSTMPVFEGSGKKE